jgi:hypothetical protein
MKNSRSEWWLRFRIAIIAGNILAISFYPRSKTNLDWTACLLVSGATSLGLFLWLNLIRSRPEVEWSDPYSWRKPFFPMNLYPMRFWFLGSISFIAAGSIALLLDLKSRTGHEAFGGTFLFWGIGIFIALEAWRRLFYKG